MRSLTKSLSHLLIFTLCISFTLSFGLEHLRTLANTDDKKPPLFIGDSLHDYLYDLDKAQLQVFAIALDYYHIKNNKSGAEPATIEQHSDELSSEFLREFITKEVNEHPEINDIGKLEDLVKEYRNSQEIKSYLASLSRDDLVTLAFKCEKHHKKAHGMEHSMGGLHDYIFRLSDDQVREYIMKESQEHEELNSTERLKLLLTDEMNSDEQEKSIEEIIKNLSKNQLMRIIPLILKNIDSEIFNAKLNYNYMSRESLKNFIEFLISGFKIKKDEIYKEIKKILNDITRTTN